MLVATELAVAATMTSDDGDGDDAVPTFRILRLYYFPVNSTSQNIKTIKVAPV